MIRRAPTSLKIFFPEGPFEPALVCMSKASGIGLSSKRLCVGGGERLSPEDRDPF